VTWPAAEVDVDEDLVRALLAEQHSDLSELSLAQIDAGFDNTLWRLGDEFLVRLPRRELAGPLILNEQRWLPALAPRLPLPIPNPVRIGRPSGRYPWSWSIAPWLEGIPGDRAVITEPEDAADRLGRFLRALHVSAPPEAPHNEFRGVGLSHRAGNFERRVAALGTEIDLDGAQRVWDRGLSADAWSGPPVWVHGDLHPANILFLSGTVAAIIDFGDLCAGDPATDLAAAWMVLPSTAMAAFREAYGGIDAALGHRSLAWAVLFALIFLELGLGGRTTYETIGRATLASSTACVAR
jgi:aminoglycoside phosphotransferase (APT) family kinase protein